MKTKIWKLKLVSILIGLGISFLLLELSARVYMHISKQSIESCKPSHVYYDQDFVFAKRMFKSHPFLPYCPVENDRRIITKYFPAIKQNLKYEFKLNSLGFRTPETSFEKPVKTKRIITLG